jgi:hypothetical protein
VRTSEDTPRFAQAESLENALSKTPDVRADKVENARMLVGDPHYPPLEIQRRIAALLAMNIRDIAG